LNTRLAHREKQLQDQWSQLQKKMDAVKSERDYAALLPEVKAYEDNVDQHNWDKERHDHAQKMRGKGYGNAAGAEVETTTKTVDRSPLPMDIPVSEWKNMWSAAVKRQAYTVDTKHMNNVTTKAPFGESGSNTFATGNLPPVLLPQLTLDQPLEPDRVFDHLKPMRSPEARAVEYLQHTGNAAPAGMVAELGVIPDVGQQWTTVTQVFQKVGGIATYSLESIADSFDIFMSFVPGELQRLVIDQESNQVINGSGTGANLLGILNTSGTLTRSVGSDTPLDAVRKAVTDIRNGSAFAVADTLIVNPLTAADLFLQKTTTGAYIVNPSDPAAHANLTDLFGLKVVANTYCPVGTGIVYDSQWIYGWVRQSLTIDMSSEGVDPSGTNLWTQWATSFRCVERIGTGIARPTAVNIVTGLPSS
jgi:hypothetical protein